MATDEPQVPRLPDVNARLLSADDPSGVCVPVHISGLPEQCSQPLRWIPVCAGDVHFGPDPWLEIIQQLIHHPEQSSKNILRADVLQEEQGDSHTCEDGVRLLCYTRRILRPRRPNLDASMPQDCRVYETKNGYCATMTPRKEDGSAYPSEQADIPYFHPAVRSIAFSYSRGQDQQSGTLVVLVIPFASDELFDAFKQPQHRLSRTSLWIIALQARLAWGRVHGYKKRMTHDVLVARNDYMDLYQTLRQKYAKIIIDSWVEKTDPKKHVFEDIGIATFLILLWRDMFHSSHAVNTHEGSPTWGRPKCFVDIGCGNGLLVYLLNAEGYHGLGIDLRERKTWNVVRALPGSADLREATLHPHRIAAKEQEPPWPQGAFLIGNHADELTSWIPLMAASDDLCPGFINIPCCRFGLDGAVFSKTKYRVQEDDIARLLPSVQERSLLESVMTELQRGPPTLKDSTSRNVAYLRYLSHLHLQAGWKLEKEALRIPSTKNWTIVARQRLFAQADASFRDEVALRIHHLAMTQGATWTARMEANSKSLKSH